MPLLFALLVLAADFEGTAKTNVPVYAEKSVEGQLFAFTEARRNLRSFRPASAATMETGAP